MKNVFGNANLAPNFFVKTLESEHHSWKGVWVVRGSDERAKHLASCSLGSGGIALSDVHQYARDNALPCPSNATATGTALFFQRLAILSSSEVGHRRGHHHPRAVASLLLSREHRITEMGTTGGTAPLWWWHRPLSGVAPLYLVPSQKSAPRRVTTLFAYVAINRGGGQPWPLSWNPIHLREPFGAKATQSTHLHT
jgi:hypothetical protein